MSLSFVRRAALASAVAATPCLAADYAWKATAPSNWSVSSNWTPTGVPQAGDNIISSTSTSTLQLDLATTAVNNWTYGHTGAWGVRPVSSAVTLNIGGTLSKQNGEIVTSYVAFHSQTNALLSMNIGAVAVSAGELRLGARAVPTGYLSSLNIGSADLTGGRLLLTVGADTTDMAQATTATITGALTMSGGAGVYIRENINSVGALAVGSLVSSDTTSIIAANEFSGSVSTASLILNNASGVATFAGSLRPGRTGSFLGLTKNGAGTQILSGDLNTYNGGTTVNGGSLLFTNTSNSGSGSALVTVEADGTIGGTGRLAPSTGGVIVRGTVSPGTPTTPIGTFTIDLAATTGRLRFDPGADVRFDLGAAGASMSAPGTSDLLKITGAAAGDVAFDNTMIDFGGTGQFGWYKLFDTSLASGTWTGLTLTGQQITAGLNAINVAGGQTARFYLGNGTQGDAGDIYVVIPEPATVALAAVASLGLILRPRRHRPS